MQHTRFLECLAEDASRLREVAAGDLGAPVPSCPDWTVADLVRHVGQVYLHKTECMRLNAFPRPWPPDLAAEEPLALLDRSYAALTGEFATRAPDSPSVTWFEPEQTVGFWARRMAQETVIHRLDAELALGGVPGADPGRSGRRRRRRGAGPLPGIRLDRVAGGFRRASRRLRRPRGPGARR